MISVDLARRLQLAGFVWEPAVHDRFAIPDRDLDGKVFALNDLSTEIHTFGSMQAITFNGAVEWSLDWILSEDVVWLPTEQQLRDGLGDAFSGLDRTRDGYRCRIRLVGGESAFEAAAAADAYALALLDVLDRAREPHPPPGRDPAP